MTSLRASQKTVLVLSSQTIAGAVGSDLMVPILRTYGHEVWALPTVLLTNHAGYDGIARHVIDADALSGFLNDLEARGWTERLDAVVTGYFANADQVLVVEAFLKRLAAHRATRGAKRGVPEVLYACDAVLGDDAPDGSKGGGLYIAEDLAAALKDRLLPLAHWCFPNRFELAYLSGMEVTDEASARNASKGLGRTGCLVTSLSGGTPQRIVNLLRNNDGDGDGDGRVDHEALKDVPKGTGDAFTAHFMGALLSGEAPLQALATATEATLVLSRASQGRDRLVLTAQA